MASVGAGKRLDGFFSDGMRAAESRGAAPLWLSFNALPRPRLLAQAGDTLPF